MAEPALAAARGNVVRQRPSAARPLPVPGAAALGGAAATVFFLLPFAYLVRRAAGDAGDVWDAIASRRTLEPLWRSLQLVVLVTFFATVLGVGMAWLTTRTDVPARRLWKTAAVLPLVIPSFVGGAALILAFERGGLVDAWTPIDSLPDLHGLPGAVIVLSMLSYPYVFLPVAARMSSLPPSMEESARLLGRSPMATFRTVVVPQCRAAIGAGAILVALYTASDFGGVQFVGYDTLTRRLFTNQLRRPEVATAMGLVLAAVALALALVERAIVSRTAGTAGVGSRRALVVPLGRWRWPALAAIVAVLGGALVAPVTVLAYWVVNGVRNGATRSYASDLWTPTIGSLMSGLAAAAACVVLVLPLAIFIERHRSRASRLAALLVVAGFALPGLVTAFALVTWARGSSLYQTFPLLVAGYVLHFGGQALRASQAAVAGVPLRVGEAARLLGVPWWKRLWRVELPLMAPGLVAGGGLVLLSVLKELPITLVLRPLEYETLALRINSTYENALRVDAGLSALVLLALSAVLTWVLVVRRMEHLA